MQARASRVSARGAFYKALQRSKFKSPVRGLLSIHSLSPQMSLPREQHATVSEARGLGRTKPAASSFLVGTGRDTASHQLRAAGLKAALRLPRCARTCIG